MLFDLYVSAPRWLQRLDPRTKLALLMLSVLLFLAAPTVMWLALLIALFHVGLLSSQVPWARMQWVLIQLRTVLFFIFLLFPLMAAEPGNVLVEFGGIDLKRDTSLACHSSSRSSVRQNEESQARAEERFLVPRNDKRLVVPA